MASEIIPERLARILLGRAQRHDLCGWFVVTRFSVTRELRLWDVTALRFGIGAVILLPVLLRGKRRLSAKEWREGLVYACLWGLPFVLAVALGLQLTSAGRAAAIAPTLMPVFAGAFAWIFLKEKQGRARWCGYLAIIIGLVFMVAGGVSADGGMNPMGLIALMTAAAMWAVYTLLFRRSALTPVQAAALICFWSAILFLPIYIFGGLSRLAMASPSEIGLQGRLSGRPDERRCDRFLQSLCRASGPILRPQPSSP